MSIAMCRFVSSRREVRRVARSHCERRAGRIGPVFRALRRVAAPPRCTAAPPWRDATLASARV
jgi:hypothetical protein